MNILDEPIYSSAIFTQLSLAAYILTRLVNIKCISCSLVSVAAVEKK